MNLHSTAKAPNGFLGGNVFPIFVEATKNGDFALLRVITSKESEAVTKAAAANPGKVEVVVLSYGDKAAWAKALKGVDIVVSTMGGNEARIPSEQALIEVGE